MLIAAALALLGFLSLLELKKLSFAGYGRLDSLYLKIKAEYDNLQAGQAQLRKELFLLKAKADEIIALYDITREICKSLQEEKVFANFKQRLSSYLQLDDCSFFKKRPDNDGRFVLPLSLKKTPLGYLVATGLSEADRHKFEILSQQFLLGLKRAFLYEKLQQLSVTDTLTRAFNRRYLFLRLDEEIERCAKFNYSFSFLMADIDYFKSFNDKFGHLVGDAVLREVARTIKENTREIDLVARFGGEEFAVIMPQADKESAFLAAERIRRSLEQRHLSAYDQELRLSLSIGIASFPQDARQARALINRADEALYRAKHEGRNRVCQ